MIEPGNSDLAWHWKRSSGWAHDVTERQVEHHPSHESLSLHAILFSYIVGTPALDVAPLTSTMSTPKELDPYTAKAENDNLSTQQKIEGLHGILKKVKTGMLITRTADGRLHSRAMAPAGRKS